MLLEAVLPRRNPPEISTTKARTRCIHGDSIHCINTTATNIQLTLTLHFSNELRLYYFPHFLQERARSSIELGLKKSVARRCQTRFYPMHGALNSCLPGSAQIPTYAHHTSSKEHPSLLLHNLLIEPFSRLPNDLSGLSFHLGTPVEDRAKVVAAHRVPLRLPVGAITLLVLN